MDSVKLIYDDSTLSISDNSGDLTIMNKANGDTIICSREELSRAIAIMEHENKARAIEKVKQQKNEQKIDVIQNRLAQLEDSLIAIHYHFMRTNMISSMVDERLDPVVMNLKEHVDYYALENYNIEEINEICRR